MVGAGIARPSSTGNAVQPLRLVPAEMGRAMPAPTVCYCSRSVQGMVIECGYGMGGFFPSAIKAMLVARLASIKVNKKQVNFLFFKFFTS